MKKYHVYGMGNALVDKEFEVGDDFFERNGIQKGFMTLVDGESQEKLLEKLTKEGNLRKQAGGGSAANTIYAASQFGANAFYTCKVSNDEFGDFYLKELGHHNIHTNLDNHNRDDGVTGKCLVMVSPDAERTMMSYLGISETLSETELDLEALKDSEYLYVEGYLSTSDSARAAYVKARDIARNNGVKTALTFSDPSMVQYFRGGLEEMIGDGVDLLFSNVDEARIWTDKESLEDVGEALKATAKQFVITLGAKGALAFDGKDFIEIAPHKVKAIDTNGAGDMFAGAFLYGIAAGHDMATAGKIASLASATVVSNFGPRLTLDQHEAVLKQVLSAE